MFVSEGLQARLRAWDERLKVEARIDLETPYTVVYQPAGKEEGVDHSADERAEARARHARRA